MTLKLERFVSPGKGNGVRAVAGIRRGELLYSAEPLACCVSNKQAREVCHHCFTRVHLCSVVPSVRRLVYSHRRAELLHSVPNAALHQRGQRYALDAYSLLKPKKTKKLCGKMNESCVDPGLRATKFVETIFERPCQQKSDKHTMTREDPAGEKLQHETLLRCSQCKMARYCNITCQKQAWPVHKRECKCLRSLLPRVPTDSVRLTARIILSLINPSQCSKSEELYTLEEHESHLSSVSEQKKQGLSQLASMLELYLQQEVPHLKQEMASSLPPSCLETLSLVAKVTCNCFTISDGELREIGVGLYPSLSLLNHDCRPNCVMVFEGTRLQLRAVRDISTGEELTVSYIETLSLTEERQKQLDEQYHFTCHCQCCDSKDKDKLMLSGTDTSWQLLKEALPALEKLKAESNWDALLERCSHLLSTDGGEVPDENLYKLQLTDMALDAAIQVGVWETALKYGAATLPVYKQYFPDPHPVHGVQLMRVGKLQHYLEHLQDALETFKQAYQIIKITHGDDHSLTKDLMMKMEECCAEIDQQSSRRK